MKTSLIIGLTAFFTWIFGAFTPVDQDLIADSSVQDLLIALGDPAPKHYFEQIDKEKAALGRELVYNGRAKLPDGGYSDFISSYYVCTDCHNQVQEDPVLPVSDPEARLSYAIEHDLPFLQATTFWGMVNRETWYNDDYVLKYGSLVEEANKSLAASTQLCAKECSSGRYLEDWELEAIMQYYWTIDVELSDLKLSDKEMDLLEKALGNEALSAEAIKMLKSKYALKSAATFDQDHIDGNEGFPGLTGDAKRGELIYEKSCQTCHREYGPSQLILGKDKFTLKKFKKNFSKESYFNLYYITRHGTYAEPGHRQYMPLYTKERLSNQQIEDLRAFIEEGA